MDDLVDAIYHRSLADIRALLEQGVDPNAPVDDGFPPLVAALTCARPDRGLPARDDVDQIIRLLLAFGADANQRGINDYTALHMAVAERNALAVQLLLDAGADPDLPTRIDDYETPLEMATRAGLSVIAAILRRRGKSLGRRLRSGITVLTDIPGSGAAVRRQHRYRARVYVTLSDGSPVPDEYGPDRELYINRGALMSGLFYGLEGMHVGGTRRLEIAPHLAYGAHGIPGRVPPNAVLRVEVTILSAKVG